MMKLPFNADKKKLKCNPQIRNTKKIVYMLTKLPLTFNHLHLLSLKDIYTIGFGCLLILECPEFKMCLAKIYR